MKQNTILRATEVTFPTKPTVSNEAKVRLQANSYYFAMCKLHIGCQGKVDNFTLVARAKKLLSRGTLAS